MLDGKYRDTGWNRRYRVDLTPDWVNSFLTTDVSCVCESFMDGVCRLGPSTYLTLPKVYQNTSERTPSLGETTVLFSLESPISSRPSKGRGSGYSVHSMKRRKRPSLNSVRYLRVKGKDLLREGTKYPVLLL